MDKQNRDWDQFWRHSHFAEAHLSWSKRRILHVLEPYAQKGLKALDAGCGSGFFSAYFCDRGMDTTAIDYSEKSIKLTESITCNRAKTYNCDMMANGFAKRFPHKFDLIFTDGLFEHFACDDQNELLNNLKSVLDPNGHIITFVPNLFSPWTIIRPFLMPGIEEKPFTIKELRSLNLRNDLKVIASGGINTLPWRLSLEGPLAAYTGMLLYTISQSV